MPATLVSIRHSSVSKRENFPEKTFRPAVISGGSSPGKQSEGMPGGTYLERKPKGKGTDGKGTDGKEMTREGRGRKGKK